MFDLDRWQEIWNSISNNKLRTFLSGFTIALALFVFIILSGLGQGLENGFQNEFFNANSLNITLKGRKTSISYGGFKKGRRVHFKNSDYNYIYTTFPRFIKYINPTYTKTLFVNYKNQSGKYTLTGTQPVYAKMTEDKLLEGRNLKQEDLDQLAKVVVIGRLGVKDLFKNENPIGKNLNIDGIVYKVVGVYSSENGDDAERILYAPITTLQTIYATDKIDQIELTPKEGMSIAQIGILANALTNAMKARHKVAPNDRRGIRMTNAADDISRTNDFLLVITGVVLLIAFGSLVAGIISISNIMVFTVKERTKEIGIRKALGAKPVHITGLILQEAITITLIFGYIGIVIATMLTNQIKNGLKKYFIQQPHVEVRVIIIASIILLMAGLLAGWIPARRASRIKPIAALKDE